MYSSRGFTLVELLIVIVIISLLVGMGGASYVNSLRNSRDATRRGDIVALQQSFEQYFSENNNYLDDCPNMAAPYLRGDFPTDPIGHASYTNSPQYEQDCQIDSYCVCARMERDNAGNECNRTCGVGICAASDFDWYCVENQQ